MVNKKIVIIATLIALITVGLIVAIGIKSIGKGESSFNILNETNSETKKSEENENGFKHDEEINNMKENQVDENNIQENSISESDTKEKEGKDIAIDLAKKEYGESDDSVYYYVEEKISDDVYIISVRNRETTAGIIDYEINIKTEEVSEY